MNVGFFGIQFSFGLQQTAINPIFSFLGAISDKTWSPCWGRRKPFFLIGAIVASLCLFAFPFSPHL